MRDEAQSGTGVSGQSPETPPTPLGEVSTWEGMGTGMEAEGQGKKEGRYPPSRGQP